MIKLDMHVKYVYNTHIFQFQPIRCNRKGIRAKTQHMRDAGGQRYSLSRKPCVCRIQRVKANLELEKLNRNYRMLYLAFDALLDRYSKIE